MNTAFVDLVVIRKYQVNVMCKEDKKNKKPRTTEGAGLPDWVVFLQAEVIYFAD